MNITSIGQLEDCIGVAGAPIKMKIIDHLDAAASRWIAASPVAFVGLEGQGSPLIRVAGGARGFAMAKDPRTLAIPLEALDDAGELRAGQAAGVLFLIPGIGETLRANGRIGAVGSEQVEILIQECFVHCAKALIRSDFWTASPRQAPADPEAFVAAARFLVLATMDRHGDIDVSPKGDPAGLLVRIDGARAKIAERPGNRLAFGYRNMIEQPQVAALALIPGSCIAAGLNGRAHLTTDEDMRREFIVKGKTPILATVIEGAQPVLQRSAALERAALWSGAHPPSDIDPAATFVAHVKLNKSRGAQATLVRLAANRGLVAKGLESNYKTDLY